MIYTSIKAKLSNFEIQRVVYEFINTFNIEKQEIEDVRITTQTGKLWDYDNPIEYVAIGKKLFVCVNVPVTDAWFTHQEWAKEQIARHRETINRFFDILRILHLENYLAMDVRQINIKIIRGLEDKGKVKIKFFKK